MHITTLGIDLAKKVYQLHGEIMFVLYLVIIC